MGFYLIKNYLWVLYKTSLMNAIGIFDLLKWRLTVSVCLWGTLSRLSVFESKTSFPPRPHYVRNTPTRGRDRYRVHGPTSSRGMHLLPGMYRSTPLPAQVGTARRGEKTARRTISLFNERKSAFYSPPTRADIVVHKVQHAVV